MTPVKTALFCLFCFCFFDVVSFCKNVSFFFATTTTTTKHKKYRDNVLSCRKWFRTFQKNIDFLYNIKCSCSLVNICAIPYFNLSKTKSLTLLNDYSLELWELDCLVFVCIFCFIIYYSWEKIITNM